MGNPIFETVASTVPNRNLFNLSHEHKFTCRHGSLVPALVQECLPGDSFRVNPEVFLRYAPMLCPMFQRVDAFLHFFFVPNRLVYDRWNEFLVGGPDGTDTTHFVPPYSTIKNIFDIPMNLLGINNIHPSRRSSLWDYFGLPTVDSNGMSAVSLPYDTHLLKMQEINLIPFRAYQLIYDEYYRDENLETSAFYDDVLNTGAIHKSGGYVNDLDELAATFTLHTRAFRKDYFTISLPWAQRGPQVLLPLMGTQNVSLPVTFHGENMADQGGNLARRWMAFDPTSVTQDFSQSVLTKQDFSSAGNMYATADGTIDLSTIGSTSLADFRVAIKTQEWLEKNARGGCGRYIETILVHFGVRTPDARLQRPEYITGIKLPVQVSEVPQTSAETTFEIPGDKAELNYTTPAGTLYGKAVGSSSSGGFDYYCYEHGFLFCIFSVLPRQAYFQGIPRMFQRLDKFDYYWPSFAHLGEQEVKQKELFFDMFDRTGQLSLQGVDGNAYVNEATFGYQSRYCEYKTNLDKVSGMFVKELSYWHMARKFATDDGQGTETHLIAPQLSSIFVHDQPYMSWSGSERVFAGQGSDGWLYYSIGDDPIYVDMFFSINALRPIPTFSIPSF